MREMNQPTAVTRHIPALAKKLVLPHLVAIYDAAPDQIGTGFLVCRNGAHTLWTARHTLFGHSFDEQPLEKYIFATKKLQSLSQIASAVSVPDDSVDLAMVSIEPIPGRKGLPFRCLQFSTHLPPVLTVVGFLSRDFRRSAARQLLRPKPYIYSDTRIQSSEDEIGIRYTRRAITSDTGVKEMSPIPRGLSGSPMINAVSLIAQRNVEIFGVFTEYNPETSCGIGAKLSSAQFWEYGAQ